MRTRSVAPAAVDSDSGDEGGEEEAPWTRGLGSFAFGGASLQGTMPRSVMANKWRELATAEGPKAAVPAAGNDAEVGEEAPPADDEASLTNEWGLKEANAFPSPISTAPFSAAALFSRSTSSCSATSANARSAVSGRSSARQLLMFTTRDMAQPSTVAMASCRERGRLIVKLRVTASGASTEAREPWELKMTKPASGAPWA